MVSLLVEEAAELGDKGKQGHQLGKVTPGSTSGTWGCSLASVLFPNWHLPLFLVDLNLGEEAIWPEFLGLC